MTLEERRGGGGFACVFTQGTAPTCALHHVSMSTYVLKKTLPLDQSESQQFVKKSSQTKQSIGWCMTWNRLSWDSMAICHYVQFQHGLHNWITRICCGYLKQLTTFCYNSLKIVNCLAYNDTTCPVFGGWMRPATCAHWTSSGCNWCLAEVNSKLKKSRAPYIF